MEDVVRLLEEWVTKEDGRALVWVSHHAYQVRELATRRVTMEELAG